MTAIVSIYTQEPQIYLLFSHILSVAGYKPEIISTFDFNENSDSPLPHAVLLDTRGDVQPLLEVCRSIKQNPATRKIILIAIIHANNEQSYLQFLHAGADECLVRPVPPERILSFLQRLVGRRADGRVRLDQIRIGDIEILSEKRAVRRGEMEVQLTPIEFRILSGFMQAPGHVLDREELIKVGWPTRQFVQSRNVDVHVGHLRRHLQNLTGRNVIRTIRASGYALEIAQDTSSS